MNTISGIWKLAILIGGMTNCLLISPAWSQIDGASLRPLIGGQRLQDLQFFSPRAEVSSALQQNAFKEGNFAVLLRVREAQVRKAVSILKQQNETVTDKQLHDLHWQKGFVDDMKPDHPFRRSAAAWWRQNRDIALPPALFSLLSDSEYRIERLPQYRDAFEKSAAVGLPRAALDGRDKMEVDTGEAARVILSMTPFEIGDENNAVRHDILQEDAEQIRSCSAAVNMLRVPFEQTGSSVLDHFNHICLFESNPTTLTDDQRRQTIECLNLYAAYDEACFYHRYDSSETALAPLGVLFKVGGQLAATIHCMAYRISGDILLTARHCLDDDVMQDSYSLRDDVFYFQPLQHQIDHDEMISMAQSLGRPAGCSIVRIFDPANLDLSVEVPPAGEIMPEDDMILLQTARCPKQMLSEDRTAQQLKLRVDATPKGLEPLILAGFNDMSFRIALLRARLEDRDLPGDFDLLVDGSWRRFVRQDESAVCRIGSVDSPLRQEDPNLRQLGHYCQTQPGMSGAPLIAMRNVTRRQGTILNDREVARLVAEPVLVGIHRRAPGMSARINGNIPERNGPPNAGISLGNQVSAVLSKLIQ